MMMLKIILVADEEDDHSKESDFVEYSSVDDNVDDDVDDDDDDDDIDDGADDDIDDHDDQDDHQMITVEEVISSKAVR